MNITDIARIHIFVGEAWPHSDKPVDDDRLALQLEIWSEVLDGLEFDETREAVVKLMKEGREFAPPVGVIRKKALEARNVLDDLYKVRM